MNRSFESDQSTQELKQFLSELVRGKSENNGLLQMFLIESRNKTKNQDCMTVLSTCVRNKLVLINSILFKHAKTFSVKDVN